MAFSITRRSVEMSPRDAPFIPATRPDYLDINQADYATQVTAALGMQSRVPGHLDKRVSLGLQVDDYTKPEFWWLRRGIRGYAGDARAAFAGQQNFFALQCQPGSLLVVEKLYVCSIVAPQYFRFGIQADQPAAAAATAGTPLDSRAFGQGAAARWVLSSNAAPTPPVVSFRVYCPAGVLVSLELDAVVTGGNWFSVIASNPNTETVFTAIYRERQLLPSEE